MVADPAATPVTTPHIASTVAIAVLLLVHVPPAEGSDKEMEGAPTTTLVAPEILPILVVVFTVIVL